ncbi:MAG: hypothetical protein Q9227_001219 [Pyrenula ochraceoflavens]
MSTQAGAHVYTGPWINWSHGLVLGSTITLSSTSGSLFTSFLAAFVTVVGAQLWKILMFVIHQSRASRGPQDGLHHQHQVLFRNSQNPGSAAWTFLQQAYHWRNRASVFRSLPWALFCLSYLSIFGLVSVFSGEIAKSAGNNRLIRSANCGYWRLAGNGQLNNTALQAFNAKNLNDTTTAASYARECYSGDSNSLQCGTMAAPSIPWTTNRNATCPFGDSMCIWSDTSAFQINATIDSHALLGINAPKHDRIIYKKVSTCAPLHTKGYAQVLNVTATENTDLGKEGDTIVEYYYGKLLGTYYKTKDNVLSNYSYVYNTHASMDGVGYMTTALFANANSTPGESWTPLPAMNKSRADITLLFLSMNGIRFSRPSDDPVFSAHLEGGSITTTDGEKVSWYDPDHYVSVCNPIQKPSSSSSSDSDEEEDMLCTPLVGSTDFLHYATDATYSFTPLQQGAIDRISAIAQFTNIYSAVNMRGASALRAQETLNDLDQAPLPNNQWTVEVTNWFTTGLARLQRGVLEYATGPLNVGEGSYVWQPGNKVHRKMCRNQIVKAGAEGTISFGVLGVAIILAVGGGIILISLILEPIVGFIQMRRNHGGLGGGGFGSGVMGKGMYKRLNWILDDKFQLQRMVFEEAGMGEWDGALSSVPVSRKGERFGGWEGVDPTRPRLGRRGEGEEDIVEGGGRVVARGKGGEGGGGVVEEIGLMDGENEERGGGRGEKVGGGVEVRERYTASNTHVSRTPY